VSNVGLPKGLFFGRFLTIGGRGFSVSARKLRLLGTFGAAVSAGKNPVPGAGREIAARRKCRELRAVSLAGLRPDCSARAEAKVLELAAPVSVGISQALDLPRGRRPSTAALTSWGCPR
jgi:hypothetical protein